MATTKYNVVAMTENGYRAILTIKHKTLFCKRVAQREAAEYSATHNRPARIIDEHTPVHEIDAFVRGYFEAALWSSTDSDGNPMDESCDIAHIDMMTLEKGYQDCDDFRASNRVMLNRAYRMYAATSRGNEWAPQALAGHDFWLTRNRHGAGFWDRGFKEVGDALSDAAKLYCEVDLYIGDDGKVYV